MALEKVEYTDKKTVVSAKNMNDIQDAIIALEENGGGSGGGSNTLIVNIDDDRGAWADKTPEQIYEHIQAGGDAMIKLGDSFIKIDYCTEGYAIATHGSDESFLYVYEISTGGSFHRYEYDLVTYDVLGDISSALEEIREYAQGLIEGGES